MYWNLIAFIAVVLGFGAGVVAWAGLTPAFGQTQLVKAVCFMVGGIVISAFDFAWRWRHDVALGRQRYFSSTNGGWSVIFPVWLFGIIVIAGGAYLMFSEAP